MKQLPLLEGYSLQSNEPDPPQLNFAVMLRLALRTWPFMRPMWKHLITLIVLAGIGIIPAIAAGFVGVDLINNKVLLGEKLQPFQAVVLFVDESYVTTDLRQLGKQTEDDIPNVKTESTGLQEPVELKEQLTSSQRRVVRNRLVMWGIVGGILGTLLGFCGWYYTVWIWQSVNQNLRVAMVEQAESLSLRYHDQARVGDAIFRVYQDSSMIVNLIQSGILSPLFTLYAVVVAFFIVLAFDPLIAGFAVVSAVPFILLLKISTRRIRRRALANRVANSDLTSHIQETFTALKVIKANASEAQIQQQFDHDSKRALDAAYYLRLDMVIFTLLTALIGGVLVILSEYVFAQWIIVERETFLGAAVAGVIGFAIWNWGAFEIARARLSGLAFNAGHLLGIWMRMQDLFIALRRAFDLLDVPVDIVEHPHPRIYPTPIATIDWRSVSFAYEENAPNVLVSTTLRAEAGKVTAIVGSTGSGKSTMMALLLRLFDPDTGEVQINGIDLKELRLDDVRRNCAIALQKNVLFNETVANNIAFGAGSVSRAQIERAAEIADAAGFIQELEKGYDTELGERGGKLSAGQRQRLSIARAVVRDTQVLILDEPTASLDARTEQRVLANLAEWGTDKVILLITHRLSTIQNADQIALLDEGRIVESGTHAELLSSPNGRYAAFVQSELSDNRMGESM